MNVIVIYHFNAHFSIFLPMIYYLLFILHLYETMEMMLEKKQIPAIFLFQF